MLAGQAGEQVQVAFVGLIQVLHRQLRQGGGDAGGQVIGLRQFLHDGAQSGVVPAAAGALAQALPHVGTAGANADAVGGTAVLSLIDHKTALVHQLADPAQLHVDGGPLGGDGHAAIGIVQGQAQLVGFFAPAFAQAQLDQSAPQLGGNVLAVYAQAVVGLGIAHSSHHCQKSSSSSHHGSLPPWAPPSGSAK